MPNSILGWTRLEIVNKVLDTLGRAEDSVLKSRLNEDINLEQLDFWKSLDWSFGKFSGVEDNIGITLVAGDGVYTLDTATISVEMRTKDIDSIYCITQQKASKLVKLSLRELRILDPGMTSTGFPTHYAKIDENRIQLWPTPRAEDAGVILYIDGKRMPTFMTSDSDYPDIPIENQKTFIDFITAHALNRERDPSAVTQLQIAEKSIVKDKQSENYDMESSARIKYPEEETLPNDYTNYTRAAWFNFWNS